MNSEGSGRYSSQVHQRDTNRTQLFANATPYNPNFNPNTPSPGPSNSLFGKSSPESKGQYSDAMLAQLESQNDAQIEGLSAKVKMLKDITVKIGDEVRDSNKLLSDMENNFETAKVKLRGTFNRMIRMAEHSGVGWRAWLALFGFIFLIFFFVWWR